MTQALRAPDAPHEPLVPSKVPRFDAERGLIQLAGVPERWIWAFTCPRADCACRTALILSADGDRERLRVRAQPVAEALLQQPDEYVGVARSMTDLNPFVVDLDNQHVFLLESDVPVVLNAHPQIKAIASRLDEDVLDEIARVWYLGKGQNVPHLPSDGESQIQLEDWQPGMWAPWEGVQPTLRRDVYVLGKRTFEAVDCYCVSPRCACSFVVIEFYQVSPEDMVSVGRIEFDGYGRTVQVKSKSRSSSVTKLWNTYCKRHPDYRERFARRRAVMRTLSERIVPAQPSLAQQRLKGNRVCPCGSGRKFNRCCGSH